MARRRKPPLLILVFMALGFGLVYAGFAVYADSHSGTAGEAKVTECEGGTGKYDRGVHCRGSWIVGNDLISGDPPGRVAVGSIHGAGHGDVGKTIAVRIHGSDHATKPGIGLPIMMWAFGGLVAAFGLFSLWSWWRRPVLTDAAGTVPESG
jgi:hypothetical protein